MATDMHRCSRCGAHRRASGAGLRSSARSRARFWRQASLPLEHPSRQIDEARNGSAVAGGADRSRRRRRLLAQRKSPRSRVRAACRGRLVLGADQMLALGKTAGFHKASPAAPPLACSSCGAAPATPITCIRHRRCCAMATCCSRRVDTARLTMRDFSDRFHRLAISTPSGDSALSERRLLSPRRHRHSSVRAHRGRSFYHSRSAASALARLSRRKPAICRRLKGATGCSSSA